MRDGAPSLVMRPSSPPLELGIAVAAAMIAAGALATDPLRKIGSEISCRGGSLRRLAIARGW
jgi:hypothetical protein